MLWPCQAKGKDCTNGDTFGFLPLLCTDPSTLTWMDSIFERCLHGGTRVQTGHLPICEHIFDSLFPAFYCCACFSDLTYSMIFYSILVNSSSSKMVASFVAGSAAARSGLPSSPQRSLTNGFT